MAKVVIDSARPAPKGFGPDVVGLVGVTYRPSEFHGPIVVTRWQKGRDGEDGRAWPVARIVGATAVQLVDVQIRQGDRGNFYATPGSVEIPEDVLREIARAGAAALHLADHADALDPNKAAAGPREHRAAPGDPIR